MRIRLFSLVVFAGCGGGGDIAPPGLDSSVGDGGATDGGANDQAVAVDLFVGIDLFGLDLAGNGSTGDPCKMPSDCKGTTPKCITQSSQGIVWPDGYCSAVCVPSHFNADAGTNPDCPGGNDVCIGGVTGYCYLRCSSKQGNDPCLRTGYSCFYSGCWPTAYSECDPSMAMSCAQDGGFVTDGGVRSGQTCEEEGYDPVGGCYDRCDPFAQNCPKDGQGNPEGCYPTWTFGDSFCATGGKAADGAPCAYLNSCAPGLTCVGDPMGNYLCRPFCGGPNKVACKNGKACVDLSGTVKQATVGVCAG